MCVAQHSSALKFSGLALGLGPLSSYAPDNKLDHEIPGFPISCWASQNESLEARDYMRVFSALIPLTNENNTLKNFLKIHRRP